jgi:hypothetical protein
MIQDIEHSCIGGSTTGTKIECCNCGCCFLLCVTLQLPLF